MPGLERPRVEYRTPVDLVREVRQGRVRVPLFQRGFKWEAGDVVKLFDSLLRGYPIGNLLLWSRSAPAGLLRLGPLDVDAPALDTALWVVDGQQRIVSLVGALTEAERASDTRFRVHLDLETGQFHTAGPRQQPPQPWIPVSLLLDTATLLRWMRDNSEWLTNDQLDLADQAAKAIREYQIPTYVVSSDQEDPLLEIFTRMNTTGKRLTKAEVFTALNAASYGDRPLDLRTVGLVPADLGFGSIEDRLALRCVLAYQGGDVFREEFGREFGSDGERAQTLQEVAGALRAVVHFLQRVAEIPHIRLLPYSHVIFVLTRFVRLYGAPEGRAAVLLRRWVWRAAVAGTRARGISVSDVRSQVTAVDEGSPLAAAEALLHQVPSFPDFTPEPDKVHFGHAMAKINTLGLLSADPRDLVSGQPVDVARLLEAGSPLRPIVSGGPGAAPSTLANRMVSGPLPSAVEALRAADVEIAGSHLVDPESLRLLAGGDTEAFLARRGEACTAAVRATIDRMAEWGARDGRSIADLLRSAA